MHACVYAVLYCFEGFVYPDPMKLVFAAHKSLGEVNDQVSIYIYNPYVKSRADTGGKSGDYPQSLFRVGMSPS